MESERSAIWVNVLEREGWIVVTVEGRKVGIIISTTEGGKEYLKIASYHLGTGYVGDKYNILSAKVIPIPESLQNSMIILVRNALPTELRGLPISFL
jgi:DNA-binding PadR family transcriptional regulator